MKIVSPLEVKDWLNLFWCSVNLLRICHRDRLHTPKADLYGPDLKDASYKRVNLHTNKLTVKHRFQPIYRTFIDNYKTEEPT